MQGRVLFCAIALPVLAACGGGGSSVPSVNPTSTPHATPTPSPTATPGPYATIAPASTRKGDVTTVAFGGGGNVLGFWPDFNVALVSVGNALYDAAGGTSAVATAGDQNNITAVTYSAGTRSMLFSTGSTIYSVGMTGTVTTVATGLGNVESLAVGSDGTTYAIDTDHVVKLTGGVPSFVTLPGSIGARYWNATPSLAVAPDGSIFFSDPTNDVISRVSPSGAISTLAGGCKAGANGFTGSGGNCRRIPQPGTGSSANFASPGSLAYDASSNTLYVCDTEANQLWAVSSSGTAAPVAGYGAPLNVDGNGFAAFLNSPQYIAFDPLNETVEIMESAPQGQQEIAAYSGTGTTPPAQSNPATAYYISQGLLNSTLAASPDKGAWSASSDRSAIVRISATGAVTTYTPPSGISPNWHVAVDANGNAWYLATQSDPATHISVGQGVLEVTPSGSQTYVAVPAQQSGVSATLYGITIGPDGNPWFTEDDSFPSNGASFGFVNPSTHAPTQYAASAGAGAISPAPNGGIAFSSSNSAGQSINLASLNGALGTSYPVSLFNTFTMQYRATDQTIWFSDGNNKIGSLSSTGTEQDYTLCGQCDPLDLAITPDGSVWSDEGNTTGEITRITPSGTAAQYPLPIWQGPTYGISARSDGKLWVWNNAGVLYLFDPAAYDAMNGPHPAAYLSHKPGASTRYRWHTQRRF
jgi:streptogramin lyase